MDARYLAAMEALMGTRFHHDDEYEANPGPIAALTLESDFQNYIDMVTVRLLAQCVVSSFLIDVSESPDTADLSDVYNHPLSWLGTLPFNRLTNELSGDLDDLLQFYVRSHAEGSTPPLDIDDTIALLRMLHLDFGQDEAAYRTAVEAAFVAAGFTATVAGDYANRAIEPHMRYVNGTDGADRLQSTERSEVLVGGTGDDTYVWGSRHGNDVTDEEGGPDDNDTVILEGLNPEDILVRKFSAPGYRTDLMIVIQATGEWLILDDQGGNSEDDIERIVFADGTVWDKEALSEHARLTHVIGTKDGDNLTGTDGDDWLEGQGGNDTLSGGARADWYVFEEGDGADVVDDGGTDRDTDKLIIRGYNSSDATLSRSGNDAVITFANGDKVTLTDQMAQSRAFIERIVFADGTEWTAAEFRTHVFDGMRSTGAVAGTPMADTYTHALGDGSYSITEQDDRWGRHPRPADVLRRQPRPGLALARRGLGGDHAVQRRTRHPGEPDGAVLRLHRTHRVRRRHRVDRNRAAHPPLRRHEVDRRGGRHADGRHLHPCPRRRLLLHHRAGRPVGAAPRPADVLRRQPRPGLALARRGSAVITLSNGERVTLVNQMAQSYAFIERIVFADGTEWALQDLRARLLLDLATDGHDVIHGFDGDDSIVGGLGDDTLYGGDGSDTVKGMAGNDVLHGGDGDDDLFGGDDDDVLHGSQGADSFDGGTGNDTIDFSYSTYDADVDLATGQVVFSTGHTERLVSIENVVGTRGDNAITGSDTANTLNGGNGNDTLTGGAGNDILFGAAGADTFVFNTDDGADTIEDFEDEVDTIRFGISGLTFADLTIADDGDDALITYDGGDTIRLTDTSSEDLTASDFAFA